jgi:hypothetical protein
MSQTPLSQDLPSWVRYLAQDADGTWWGYEVEPNLGDSCWYENEVGHRVRLGRTDVPNPLWKGSLVKLKFESDLA